MIGTASNIKANAVIRIEGKSLDIPEWNRWPEGQYGKPVVLEGVLQKRPPYLPPDRVGNIYPQTRLELDDVWYLIDPVQMQ